MKHLVCVSLLAIAWADAGRAQLTPMPPAVTSIIADTLPGRSLGTTVSTSSPVTTIDGGTLSGSNLFHSFSTFDVAVGDTARWVYSAGDPSSIGNVINRVTGGTPSQIFGMLDSTALPNADFYFINPAGIVFGAGAQVNVPAAAHFSTASNLHFTSSETFAVATPDGSTLSVAAPSAFGFIGNEGDILASGAGHFFPWMPEAFLPNGGSLSLSAANVAVDASYIQASGLAIAATGTGAATVDTAGAVNGQPSGHVTISNNSRVEGLEVNGGVGGPLSITAGTVSVDGSGISTRGGTFGVAGPIAIFADELNLNSSTINSIGMDTAFTFTAAAGPIDIDVGNLSMTNSLIRTDNSGTANGDNVTINIRDHLVMSGSWITADNGGFADTLGGSVIIRAADATLTNSSRISAVSFGSGDGGTVDVAVQGHFGMTNSNIFTGANGDGDGGAVILGADSMSLTNSLIDSRSLAGGDGGDIEVNVTGTLELDFGRVLSTVSAPDETSTPSAGAVSVSAHDLIMAAGSPLVASTIASTSTGAANGGSVNIDVTGSLVLGDYASIAATNLGNGNAGTVNVSAGEASLALGSSISSSSTGIYNSMTDVYTTGGNAGSVEVDVDGQLSMSAAEISSNTEDGLAGNVTVSAGSALISDLSFVSSDATNNGEAGVVSVSVDGLLALDAARISTNAGEAGDGTTTGDAGAVQVSASDISLINGAAIDSKSFGLGQGGDVAILATGKLTVVESFISSDALGDGDAGSVFVHAGEAELDQGWITSDILGDGQGGLVDVLVDGTLDMKGFSFISTDSLGDAGVAGDVHVEAAALNMDESTISSSAYFDGDAGTVSVEIGGELFATNGSLIVTDIDGSGQGGSVFVSANGIQLAGESAIASDALEFSSGQAGSVFVEAEGIELTGGSAIQSTGFGEGSSGTVGVEAASILLQAGSEISTNSFNVNSAGQVTISAGDLHLDGVGTRVASENLSDTGGDAGAVAINASHVILNGGASVSTSSISGAAGDIHFNMPADGLLILQSAGQPSAIETSSGPGTGGVITIASPLAIISNGGSILALGDSGGANVLIDTRYFIASTDRANIVDVAGTLNFTNSIYDVSAGTTDADLSLLDASSVLRGQCGAVRATGTTSQLNLQAVGPYGDASLAPRPTPVPATVGGGCQ